MTDIMDAMGTSRTTAARTAARYEVAVVLGVGGLAVITAGLYLWAIRILTETGQPGIGPWWTYGVFAAANSLTAGFLWWHRRFPLRVFGVSLLVFVVSALLLGDTGNAGLTLPLWFSVYSVAAYTTVRIGLVAVAGGWLLNTAVKIGLAVRRGQQLGLPEIGLLSLDLGLFYLTCFAVGLGMRLYRQRASDAAARARLVEQNARAVNAQAVATERNRMARDLHDLAAHEVMDVLLSVRALRVSSDDPALAEAEEKAARALDNMRSVVRTLREEDTDEPSRQPLPDAARHLIDSITAHRLMVVDSRITVDSPVGDAAALTTLSVLKEALLNAHAHAPGQPVSVDLDGDETALRHRPPLTSDSAGVGR